MIGRPRSRAAPEACQIVWWRFPEDRQQRPVPKSWPALIVAVYDDADPDCRVLVAYALAGLSCPTKFNLKAAVELPYDTTWFAVPPAAPFGQTPKLGVLHPSLHRRVAAAWKAGRCLR